MLPAVIRAENCLIARVTDARPSKAVVILASPKTDGHSLKVRLVVTMMDVRS